MENNEKRDFNEMSVDELLAEISKIHKKIKPQKAKIENGAIILDPNNKNDREWYENDKDYDVL